jgi:hypothetical protein
MTETTSTDHQLAQLVATARPGARVYLPVTLPNGEDVDVLATVGGFTTEGGSPLEDDEVGDNDDVLRLHVDGKGTQAWPVAHLLDLLADGAFGPHVAPEPETWAWDVQDPWSAGADWSGHVPPF